VSVNGDPLHSVESGKRGRNGRACRERVRYRGWVLALVAILALGALLVGMPAVQPVQARVSSTTSMVPPPVYSPPPPVEGDAPMDPPLHAQIIEYRVQPGDTLSEIAEDFGTDASTLAVINEMDNWNRLQPGDTVKVLTMSGLLHKVAPGETAEEVARKHGVDKVDLLAVNGLRENQTLQVGEELIVPGARPQREAVLAARGELYRWPLRGRLTSPFGYRWGGFHSGIDIAASPGTPVGATRPGRVRFAGWRGAYGNLVIVDHGEGITSYYAHLSSIAVSVGQTVDQGTTVGRVGSTGRSTGPHLHFEIRVNGDPRNPMDYLP